MNQGKHQKELSATQRAEVERQMSILASGTVEIVPENGLKDKLIESIREDRPLKVKLGLDPTAPDIHVGHTVVIQKLRQFQDCGHQVQLILGDFTAQIGDPTGKSETRKQLTPEDVLANARTYAEQYGKILDMDKTKVFYNSKWLEPLTFAEIIRLSATTTVARMLERDDFENRYRANAPISIHEFFYPLMQAYDSVALESDIEIGGTDQKFNILMGRHVQKEYGQAQQIIMTMPLLEGLDGVQKMSKSLGNYIGISEEPNQIYGKAMSVPDELMIKYFELGTSLSLEQCQELARAIQSGELHPRDAKMQLARTFVSMYYGAEEATKAEQHFQAVFQKGQLPDDMPEKKWTGAERMPIIELISELGLVASKGDARRMIQQGAVKLNGEKIDDLHTEVQVVAGLIVQVGKRKFVRII